MSYNIEELFLFTEYFTNKGNGYAIAKYLKNDDPSITEPEIPAEYNGKPVLGLTIGSFAKSNYLKRVVIPPSVLVIEHESFILCENLETIELSEGLIQIGDFAFQCTGLKSVVLPKSLERILWGAFLFCEDLERVEFNSSPDIFLNAFGCCPKLPPETVAMGLVCSTDITRPIPEEHIAQITDNFPAVADIFRPDVFELLAKNNGFQNYDLKYLFELMFEARKAELIPIAEQYGMLDSAGLLDSLIGFSAENQMVEITAYLLELKKRKFGFDGGGDFEL